MAGVEVKEIPLGKTSEILLGLLSGSFAAIWGLAIYAYLSLPDEIPLHFDFNGNPISTSPKWMFLLIPLAFSPAPLLFLIMTKYRFAIIRKYPSILNVPPQVIEASNLTAEERGAIINRVFEAALILGAVLSFWLLVLEYLIFLAAISNRMPPLYISSALLSVIVIVLMYVYLYLRSIFRQA